MMNDDKKKWTYKTLLLQCFILSGLIPARNAMEEQSKYVLHEAAREGRSTVTNLMRFHIG